MLTREEFIEIEDILNNLYDIHNPVRNADFKDGIMTALGFIYKDYTEGKEC